MQLDAAVLTDESKLAKTINEQADPGPCSADHLCQSFLRDVRNKGRRFLRLPKFGHQQENPRQSFFAGVEKPIDKICLGPHTSCQQEL